MNKNIALLALTGILTLASCGQNTGGSTVNPITTYSLGITVNGANGTVSVKNAAGTVVGTVTGNGTVTGLANGTYTLSSSTVTGFNTPADQVVTINGANTTATVTYTATGVVVPTTQAVTINLVGVPSAPITIRDSSNNVVSGYNGTNVTNGTVVNLPAGTYTVTGGTVTGFNAPSAASTVVVTNAATSVTLTYRAVVATAVGLTPKGSDSKLLTIEQNINGAVTPITYAKGIITVVPNANSGADRFEVFLSSTTSDLNAQNRIYDSRDTASGSLDINTANLRQGEQQYVVVRYWTGTSNTTASTILIPDNLGPQVPDVIPVSKLSPALTQQLGNYVNGTITLAFQNIDTLRDNPVGTTVLPSGVERIEWYADSNAKNGVADTATSKLIGTAYASPYQVSVNTTTLADGAYDVYAVAYDQLGNRSIITAQNLFVLNVDNTGPVNGAGSITVVDAGTGAVRDEFNRGGIDATYSPRPNAAGLPSGTCKIDAIGADAGNIDLYDSVTTAAGRNYISGLAHVTNLNITTATDGTGVGVSGNATSVTIDGQPILNRLYTLNASGRLVALTALRNITASDCVYLNVNGLDANESKVVFASDASTDLLGNAATGTIAPVSIFIDNQRPANVRFSKKLDTVPANGQSTLEVSADDSISGLLGSAQIFARDTNGSAFGGRAVQLAATNQTNYRFFRPTNANGKLDLIATVRDYAGNVSSYRSDIGVTFAGPQLVTLNEDNLFVRRQQANGQFLNFGNAIDENPVTGPVGTVHALDILNSGRTAVGFNPANVLQGGFYQEVLLANPLNRIGKGTADLTSDDLNVGGTQNLAPLFLISATESAPFASIKALEGGLFAYHASVIDKNGYVSEVVQGINY
ncbi:hypothetical protein [Deinococcus sp. Leaf326]|uniref:beta strand repeat-containing protein n=1 Tax=Deinococcus sp. Leaf326 TaxID=1736338 RepID=UPI0006FF7696|nr:hypothetical protein [Deinococcus sp. Leaf326]KQR04554.1 hypothetical protein ASF71_10980 [Deinococcus sp. Leaf326]